MLVLKVFFGINVVMCVFKGVGGGPQIYFLENCFIAFLDIMGHEASKTFYGIEKYYFFPEISRFQNRDYHRLTLRKLAISPYISKCQFLTLKV